MTVLAMGHAVLRRQRGVTLIELMVAMVLGLLVAAGIVTVFSSTSSSNKSQTQLARLQEEGRFAISRLGSDLRMANGQYCTNSGGTALAGVKLLREAGAEVVAAAFVIDLPELGGAERLRAAGVPVSTLVAFEGH